jgi:hypothetical protein
MRTPSFPLLLLPLATACTGKAVDTATHAEDTSGDDTNSGGEDVATFGLPEGASTWAGEGQVSGFTFPIEATLENTDGDLTGTVTLSDPDGLLGFGTGTYTVVGTHAPESGVFAMAPVAWTVDPAVAIELLGATGTHDPDAGTLTGQLRDYASGDENFLRGEGFTLNKLSGDGAPTPVGDGSKALPATATLSGTTRCTASERELAGSLTHDGAGRVTATFTLGDPGLDTPLGTFEVDGAHNPTTGMIKVAPLLWVEPDHSTKNFGVTGAWDPATGAWGGHVWTDVAACPPGTWAVVVDG